MGDYPQAPICQAGLDTSGQFHIGNGITIGAEAGYIRIFSSGASVRVTSDSLACLINGRYFQNDQIQA
jgi:hypothetical protein